jgi:4-alpha-glucanotransferase
MTARGSSAISLARAPWLMLVQLEDVVGKGERANLRGTIEGHPNWRRRLYRTIEEIRAGSELRQTALLVVEARRRSAEA